MRFCPEFPSSHSNTHAVYFSPYGQLSCHGKQVCDAFLAISTQWAMEMAALLTNVQQRAIAFPLGAWGGRLGVAAGTDCLATGKALRAA
jgi:hypothetical protein